MKRFFASLLCFLLIFSVSGCSSNDSGSTAATGKNGGKTVVTVVFPSFSAPKERLDQANKEFEKENPNIIVKPTYVTAKAWNDYFTKLQTMVAGGDSPDLFRITNEGAKMFAEKNLALPIDTLISSNQSYVDKVGVTDIPDSLEEPYETAGKKYAYAWAWNNLVVHFNTKMLAEAGLSTPPSNWTVDDFLKYAKAMTKEKNGVKSFGVAVPTSYFQVSGWLYQNEASVLNKDMTKCVLDDPKAVETLQFIHDLIYKYKVAPVPGPNDDNNQQLMNGQVGMIFAGRWPETTYASSNFKDFDIQILPKMKTQVTIYGGDGFVVSKVTKHQEEAFKLATWYNASEYSQKTLLSGDAIPSRKSVMSDVLNVVPPKNGKIFSETDNIKPVEAPSAYSQISLTFEKYISAIETNETPVKEALTEATKEINSELSGN